MRMPAPEGFGMEGLIRAWRKWTTAMLGAYLFTALWIFGTSGDKASSANAWIVGALILALADIAHSLLRVREVLPPGQSHIVHGARVGIEGHECSHEEPRCGQARAVKVE